MRSSHSFGSAPSARPTPNNNVNAASRAVLLREYVRESGRIVRLRIGPDIDFHILRHVLRKNARVGGIGRDQAQQRETADEAFPGDIIGIPNHGTLRVGDTLTEGERLQFEGIPNFAPEVLCRVSLEDAMRTKQLNKALEDLAEEGVVQMFKPMGGSLPILGVVGTLQLTFIPGLTRGGAERLLIEAVRIASSRRGEGLGGDLIRWAIERGRERGCGLVQLTSDTRRTDAHRFYERLGFAKSHEGFKLYL